MVLTSRKTNWGWGNKKIYFLYSAKAASVPWNKSTTNKQKQKQHSLNHSMKFSIRNVLYIIGLYRCTHFPKHSKPHSHNLYILLHVNCGSIKRFFLNLCKSHFSICQSVFHLRPEFLVGQQYPKGKKEFPYSKATDTPPPTLQNFHLKPLCTRTVAQIWNSTHLNWLRRHFQLGELSFGRHF